MKTLRNIILAVTLSVSCISEDPNQIVNQCSTITNMNIPNINNEITSSLNETGLDFCADIVVSAAAVNRCMIASPYDNSIMIDPRVYLDNDQMFVKLAHEYAHFIYGHVLENEYTEALLSWDSCVYRPRFNEMEREADYFAGYLSAVAGRREAGGWKFLLDDAVSGRPRTCQQEDMPVCTGDYYTNEQRIEEFMAGYHEVIPED